MIYVDNAATTKIDKKVLLKMIPYLSYIYGNPSTSYFLGRKANKAILKSRETIANILNCNSNEIYFTSGGSESDNLLIKGIAHAYKYKGNHIITSMIEHPAVLNTCKELENEGFKVTYLKVNKDGFIDLKELKEAITPNTILISIMFANNEIGTIEPIKEIANIAHENGVFFHTDAVQAVGNILIDVNKLKIDALSFSGHKIYAPKGIGVAYLKEGIKCSPLIEGGGQENGMRSGTENVASIIGISKALDNLSLNINKHINYLQILRDYFLETLNKEFMNGKDFIVNGSLNNRLPGNINISFKNINGETLKMLLDQENVCVSNGSACSSGKIEYSYVLKAIGVSKEYISGTIRLTFGKYNNKREIKMIINKLKKCLKILKEKNK